MSKVERTSQRFARSTARKISSGLIKTWDWKPGTREHVFIPLIDGEVLTFAAPYHKVGNKYPKTKGGKVAPKGLTCLAPNVWDRYNHSRALELGTRGEVCPYCELAGWTDEVKTYVRSECFNTDDWENMSKRDRLLFWTTEAGEFMDKAGNIMWKDYVDRNGYFKTINNNRELLDHVETLTLIGTIETTSEEVESVIKRGDRNIKQTHKVLTPVLETVEIEKNGEKVSVTIPKMSWHLLPLSAARMQKIDIAIDSEKEKLANKGKEILEKEYVDGIFRYAYTEFEGTEDELEVTYPYVDFLFNFPGDEKTEKMESARNLVISVSDESLITEELVDYVKSIEGKLLEDAMTTFENFNKNILYSSRKEIFDNMNEDVLEYYNYLQDIYKGENEKFVKVLKGYQERNGLEVHVESDYKKVEEVVEEESTEADVDTTDAIEIEDMDDFLDGLDEE